MKQSKRVENVFLKCKHCSLPWGDSSPVKLIDSTDVKRIIDCKETYLQKKQVLKTKIFGKEPKLKKIFFEKVNLWIFFWRIFRIFENEFLHSFDEQLPPKVFNLVARRKKVAWNEWCIRWHSSSRLSIEPQWFSLPERGEKIYQRMLDEKWSVVSLHCGLKSKPLCPA